MSEVLPEGPAEQSGASGEQGAARPASVGKDLASHPTIDGRLYCAPAHPMPAGASGRWTHSDVVEEGDGCADGCCADYLCRVCGKRWRAELAQ